MVLFLLIYMSFLDSSQSFCPPFSFFTAFLTVIILLTGTKSLCLDLVINREPVSRPTYSITLWMPWQPSLDSLHWVQSLQNKLQFLTFSFQQRHFFGYFTQIALCNDSFEFRARPWRHFDNTSSDDNSIKTGLMILWIHFGILKLASYVSFPVILSLWY